MASDLLRRQYDEMVSENATLTAQLAAVTAERDALVEDNTALRWKNGDSYDTWPLAPLREPEYFKVGDRELEKTAVCRCCDSSWAWAYVSREGYCLHCVDGRADLRAERVALTAERDALTAERDAARARAERAEERIRDALDCLPRALDGSQPFSMGQRAEVMLAIESLRAAMAAASEGE